MNAKTPSKQSATTMKMLPIDRIVPSPANVRQTFDEAEMIELTNSVKAQGILQPIVVRPTGKGLPYEIVAGERRYRAAKRAKLKEMPVVIQKVDDQQTLEMMIAENEARADVPLYERAEGYHRLMADYGATLADIAKRIGKSESSVRAMLKLRHLPDKSRVALTEGKISPAVAHLIAGVGTEAMRAKAEAWALDEKYEDMPTAEELKDWIRHNCRVELKQAPFDQKDKLLVPEAGSCKSCPKRAGNMTDSAAEMRADICTDPDCYQKKVAAHGRKALDAAVHFGCQVLPEEQYSRVFVHGSWVSGSCDYVDWEAGCYEVQGKQGMTNKALFETLIEPQDLTVTVTPNGACVRLLAKETRKRLITEYFQADLKKEFSQAAASGSQPGPGSEGKHWLEQGRGLVAGVRMRARVAGLMADEEEPESEALRHALQWILRTMWARPRDEFLKSLEVGGKTVGEKLDLARDILADMDQGGLFDALVDALASIKAYSSDPAHRKELEQWFASNEKGDQQ